MAILIKKQSILVIPAEQSKHLLGRNAVTVEKDAIIIGYPDSAKPNEVADIVAKVMQHEREE